jgi:hypothetical protein
VSGAWLAELCPLPRFSSKALIAASRCFQAVTLHRKMATFFLPVVTPVEALVVSICRTFDNIQVSTYTV